MSDELKVGAGWLLLSSGPFFYLGRLVGAEVEEGDEDDGLVTLLPCYRIHEQTVQTRQGMQDVLQCIPYGAGLFSGDVPVVFDPSSVGITDLGEISEDDRLVLVELVKSAEKVKASLLTQRKGKKLGLVLPPGSK